MRARLIVALVVLSALAFAPAPFPRTKRSDRAEITLAQFQGLWRAESFESVIQNGRQRHTGWERTQVRVEGDRWTYLEGGVAERGLPHQHREGQAGRHRVLQARRQGRVVHERADTPAAGPG